MKLFLGLLLTVVAGTIGAAIGLILALLLSFLILLIAGDHNGTFWDALFQLIFYGLSTAGAFTGIVVGWYFLLRRPQSVIHAFDPNRCLKCDYDLSNNETGRCPECGKGIDRLQHRYLKRNRHA